MNFDWEWLADGVHRCRLPFLDVTVGLVEARLGGLLVDTGTTLMEAAAVDSDVRSIIGHPVTHIILTHKHFDHVLGSSAFVDAEIHCAPEVAEYMSAATAELRDDAVRHGADGAAVDLAIAHLRIPDHRTYDSVVDIGSRRVSIRHPGRGHTDADLIVVVPPIGDAERAVVFCGDLVEESGVPAIGADSDVVAWPGTLDALLAAGGPDAVYVPGHGAVVDAAFIRRQQGWLRHISPL